MVFIEIDLNILLSLQEGICGLCEKLNANLPEKVINNLGEWWEADRHCYTNLSQLTSEEKTDFSIINSQTYSSVKWLNPTYKF